jgi:hypothetical protein
MGCFDVVALGTFVARDQKKDDLPPGIVIVKAISRAEMQPKFTDFTAQDSVIPGVAIRQTVQS